MMVFAPLSPRWVGKWGNKFVVATGLSLSALSMAFITLLTQTTPVWMVIAVTMLQGIAMANIMAPATDSIMGALPRAKAGVGSAVNDTTRQTGGAFGVAVLGSLLASRYASKIAAILGSGSPLLRDVGNNVAAAHVFARLPANAHVRDRVIDASNRAFMSGYHFAAAGGALVLLATAAAVLRYLPSRSVDADSVLPDDAHTPAHVTG
jgi:MFS family permease